MLTTITFYVDTPDKEALVKQAKTANTSLSDYIRHRLGLPERRSSRVKSVLTKKVGA